MTPHLDGVAGRRAELMTSLVIMTADELMALDSEGRGKARRIAREAAMPRLILRAFLERGGPIPIDEVGVDRDALGRLDETDLIRIRDGLMERRRSVDSL
jgi:hypothetical protein